MEIPSRLRPHRHANGTPGARPLAAWPFLLLIQSIAFLVLYRRKSPPSPEHEELTRLTGAKHKDECTIADITEAMQSLVLEKERTLLLHSAVLTSLHDHVAILDRKGTIIEVNDSWKRFAIQNGLPKQQHLGLGMNYLEVCQEATTPGDNSAADAFRGIESVLSGKITHYTMEYPCHAPDEKRWFEMTVEPLRRPEGGVVISHSSITSRKLAEIELREHRQKLAHMARVASLGEIAGSLAHELNQPLTASLSSAQAALKFLEHSPLPTEQVRELLRTVVQQDKRAREVIERLRKMIKGDEPVFETLDLNQQIKEILAIVRNEMLLREVSIVEKLSPTLPPTRGDRVQLQQIFLNLIVNAAEAMNQNLQHERILTIQTSEPATGGVQVRFSDLGSGIPKDRLQAIFEPFHTTKKEGLGMGLSICRTIAILHDGQLIAANNPERGATFCLRLPPSNL